MGIAFAGTDGETHQITVSVADDNVVEPDETFYVNLVKAHNGGVSLGGIVFADGQGQGTIENVADGSGTLDIFDAQVNEEAGTISFDVKFTGNLPGGFTVDYKTTDGTAKSAGTGVGEPDFTAENSSIGFAGTNGETHQVTISLTDDNVVELDETFLVDLLNFHDGNGGPVNGVAVGDGQAVGKILNTESAVVDVVPAFPDGIIAEGTSSSQLTPADFTITLSRPVDVPVVVWFSAEDGTAKGSSTPGVSWWDYYSFEFLGDQYRSRTFPAGSTYDEVMTVSINPDSIVEMNETFTFTADQIDAQGRDVQFAGGGATIEHEVEIDDKDTATVTIEPPEEPVPEGSDAVFTLKLSNMVDADVQVILDTVDGTAGGNDFDALPSTPFTFPANEQYGLSQPVAVEINHDSIVEALEDFDVKIVSINAGGLPVSGSGPATGEIEDTDQALVSIQGSLSAAEGNTGTNPPTAFNFTVNVSKKVDAPLTITYDTIAVSASSLDFAHTVGGTIMIPANQQTGTITINVFGDLDPENDETFEVVLVGASAGSSMDVIVDGANDTSVATILDDEN